MEFAAKETERFASTSPEGFRVVESAVDRSDGLSFKTLWALREPGRGSVCIAVDEAGRLLAGRHWRAAIADWSWEFPRGSAMANEDAVQTALRELAEETGLVARHGRLLTTVHADTGVLRDDVAVVECRDFEDLALVDRDGEFSNLEWLEPGRLEAMVADGTVFDGLTMAAYLAWRVGSDNHK